MLDVVQWPGNVTMLQCYNVTLDFHVVQWPGNAMLHLIFTGDQSVRCGTGYRGRCNLLYFYCIVLFDTFVLYYIW